MSDSEYCKMLEMPINTCDVIIKPNKHKRKAVVKEVIEKVNEETLSNEVLVKKPKFKFLKNILLLKTIWGIICLFLNSRSIM